MVRDSRLVGSTAETIFLSILNEWQGTPNERSNWRLVGQRLGIHWPALDEDISVENRLAGRASGESQRSLKRWLSQRASSDL